MEPGHILTGVHVLLLQQHPDAYVCGAEGLQLYAVCAVHIERKVIHIQHYGRLNRVTLPVCYLKLPLLVHIGLQAAAERYQFHAQLAFAVGHVVLERYVLGDSLIEDAEVYAEIAYELCCDGYVKGLLAAVGYERSLSVEAVLVLYHVVYDGSLAVAAQTDMGGIGQLYGVTDSRVLIAPQQCVLRNKTVVINAAPGKLLGYGVAVRRGGRYAVYARLQAAQHE